MKTNKLQRKNISMEPISILDKKEWFLEYSVPQKCFHYDTYDRILMSNRDMCQRGVYSGYIIIDGPMIYNDLMPSMKKWWRELGLTTTDLEGRRYKAMPNGTTKITYRPNNRNLKWRG